MATKVDELDRQDIEDDEEDFDIDEWDDEELDDEDYDEDSEDDEDDEQYSKLIERAKAEATEEIVKQLSSGDQSSPVYKGLQKVISRKDQEIAETRRALASLVEHVQKNQSNSSEVQGTVEFLMETFKDALKEEDREVLAERFERFKKDRTEKSRLDNMENFMKQVATMIQQGQQGYQADNDDDTEDDQFAELRKQATEELRGIAEESGFDPDDGDLDYGDPQEPLLERIRKLRASIAKASREVDGVRRKKKFPRTRKDSESTSRLYTPGDARRTLETLTSTWLKEMRKNND